MDESIQDEINLMDYIQVIRKRKWIIILGTLLCMVVAGVVSFTMPKIYEAKVYLMITAPKYNVEFASKEGSKISTPLFDNINAETYSKIIINEHTAKDVIAKNGLDVPPNSYTVNRILGQIKVEYPRNTNLMLLKVQDTSKERAARIANTWALAFIERNEEVTSKGSSDTYHFVMDQLEKAKQRLKTSEEDLERFQKTNKIELLKEQIAGKIKQIVQYESKLDDAVRSHFIEKACYDELIVQILTDMKLSIVTIENQLGKERITLEKTNQELQKENKSIPLDKGVIGKEEINPLYVSLNEKRANTVVRISLLEKEREELLKLRQILEQEIKKQTSPIELQKKQFKLTDAPEIANQRLMGYTNISNIKIKDALLKTEVTIQSLNAKILQLRENIKEINAEVAKLKNVLAEQEFIYTRLTRNFDTAKSTFDVLSKKGEETKISSSIKSANIQLSVPATVPEFPIKPNKRQNVMIAGGVGLLASVILAFFLEFLEKNKAVLRKPAR